MKRFALFLLFLCLSYTFAATVTSAAGKAVKVGVIADLTGPAGAYGASQKNAYDLAADDLKAKRLDAGDADLTFDVEDSATDPAQVNFAAAEVHDRRFGAHHRTNAVVGSLQGRSARRQSQRSGARDVEYRERHHRNGAMRLSRLIVRRSGRARSAGPDRRKVAPQDGRHHLRRRRSVHKDGLRNFPGRIGQRKYTVVETKRIIRATSISKPSSPRSARRNPICW